MNALPATIAVVEPDRSRREDVCRALESEGRTVLEAVTGTAGLELVRGRRCDLVLLEEDLPGMSGREVCRQLRAQGVRVPIILMRERAGAEERARGLEAGADDYVSPPIDPHELTARVRARLRRWTDVRPQEPDVLVHDGLVLDRARRRVLREGRLVPLTTTEFELLYYLASRPGRVASRRELLREIWGVERAIDTRTVDAHVYRVRRKLEPAASHVSRYIQCVNGVGYRFAA